MKNEHAHATVLQFDFGFLHWPLARQPTRTQTGKECSKQLSLLMVFQVLECGPTLEVLQQEHESEPLCVRTNLNHDQRDKKNWRDK